VITIDDDDVEHGSVAVGRPTDVDPSVRHLTGPDHQHADQRRRLHLLRYDDAAGSVRPYLLALLHTQTPINT